MANPTSSAITVNSSVKGLSAVICSKIIIVEINIYDLLMLMFASIEGIINTHFSALKFLMCFFHFLFDHHFLSEISNMNIGHHCRSLVRSALNRLIQNKNLICNHDNTILTKNTTDRQNNVKLVIDFMSKLSVQVFYCFIIDS